MDNQEVTGASATQTGLSSATPIEPVPVSPLRASIPSAWRRLFGCIRQPVAPVKPDYRPRSASGLIKSLPETKRYWDADDALYNHEQPFYRYCAGGFPLIFADRYYRRNWDAKRARLTRDWSQAWEDARNATAQAIEARRVGGGNAT